MRLLCGVRKITRIYELGHCESLIWQGWWIHGSYKLPSNSLHLTLMTTSKILLASTAAAALCLQSTSSFAQSIESQNHVKLAQQSRYETLLENSRAGSIETFSRSDKSLISKISRKAQSSKRFRKQLAKNPASVARKFGLSPAASKFLVAKVRAEDLGKGTTVQSGCICSGCCVTSISLKPAQLQNKAVNQRLNPSRFSPASQHIR